MAQHVKIVGAPGFQDFRATLVDGLHEVGSSDQGPMSVVTDEAGQFFAVPSKFVESATESPEAARYREQWATKAHRNAREVYVPEALR